MIDTKAIRERADKATPGPWSGGDNPCDVYWAEQLPADEDFILHARDDVPALCDELDAVRGLLAEVVATGGQAQGALWDRIVKAVEK